MEISKLAIADPNAIRPTINNAAIAIFSYIIIFTHNVAFSGAVAIATASDGRPGYALAF
jgi:hypothetical protein